MRIFVISDTHGKIERAIEIYKKLSHEAPVDMLVHCGDHYSDALELRARLGVPVAAVKGNCDGCFDENEFSLLDTECGSFLITHGHMDNVSLSMQNLYYKALENNCVGVLFGHTHRAAYVSHEGVYLMNPGSLTKPRDSSGGTFGLLVTSDDGIWGKVYSYDDFMLPDEACHETSRLRDSGDNSAKSDSASTSKKAKVKGGHLRSLINYSDRF